MNLEDPNAWAQGAAAFRSIFEGLRSAIAMVKDLRASGATTEAQNKLVDDALDKASKAAQIAEAEVAKALGYELCRCTFPPIPMLTVGYTDVYGKHGEARMIHECPKCHVTTAGPYTFTRTASVSQ